MPTYLQIAKGGRINKKKRWKRKELKYSPQRRGKCMRVYKLTPKKPCSARRTIARVWLTSRYIIFCHFPGVKPEDIRIHTTVLVRGGRPADLPALRYRAIPGANANRYGFRPILGRKSSRSVYGIRVDRKNKRFRNTVNRKKKPHERALGVKVSVRDIYVKNLKDKYGGWSDTEYIMYKKV